MADDKTESKTPSDNGQTRRRLRARQRLITAADELFSEMNGTDEEAYAATTIDMIAERADVSRRTFFNHFSGKADVLLLDLKTSIEDHMAAFEKRPRNEHPLLSIIRASENISQSFVADPINARRAERQAKLGHLKPNQWSLIGEWEKRLTERIAQRLKGKNVRGRARILAGTGLAVIRGSLADRQVSDRYLDGASRLPERELAVVFRKMAAALENSGPKG